MVYTSNDFQKIVDNKGLIFLPDGDYNVTNTVLLDSNTRIIMSPNARILRSANNPVLGTRPGAKNINITGGTIIGHGPNLKGTEFGNLTYIFKSKNVTFEDIIFQDILGSHGIDINSAKDISILGCKFYGYKVNPNAVFREAIQIDFAAAESIPEYPATSPYYDLECCNGITIERCVFDKSDRYPAPLNAIGTHSQPNSLNKSRNIIIAKNIAKGCGRNGSYGLFLHAVNFSNIDVIDNIVEGYGRFVKMDNSTKEYNKDSSFVEGNHSFCEHVTIARNTVTMFDFFKSAGVYAISDNGSMHRDIKVLDNTFNSEFLSSTQHYITDFNNCKGVIVDGNTNNKVYPASQVRWSNCIDNVEGVNTFSV